MFRTSNTSSGYAVPGSKNRAMKGLRVSSNSPDLDIVQKKLGMSALSQDLVMNSGLAAAIIRRIVSNVIGPGLKYQPRIDGDSLGLTLEQKIETEKNLKKEFAKCINDPWLDFHGILTFKQLCTVALSSLLTSGDFFVMFPDNPLKRDYKTSIKLIDGALVRDPIDRSFTGLDIEGGIELDENGRFMAAHVWNTYPNQGPLKNNRQAKSIRVPVYDSVGEQQLYFVGLVDRIGQRRGVPHLAVSGALLKQLQRLTSSEVLSALVSSYFTVFVKDQSGMQAMLQEPYSPTETVGGGGGAGPDAEQEDKDEGYLFDLELGPGNVFYIGDKEIDIANPKHTDESFEKLYNAIAKEICASSGVPRSEVLLHFDKSYTAGKAELNEAEMFFKEIHSTFVNGLLMPFTKRFISEVNERGTANLVGYGREPHAYENCVYIGPGKKNLDPAKESKAQSQMYKDDTALRSKEYLERTGEDWHDMMRSKIQEEKLIQDYKEELGIEDSAGAAKSTVSERDDEEIEREEEQ